MLVRLVIILLKKSNKYIYNIINMNKILKIKNNNSLSHPSTWIKNNLSKGNNNLNLLDLACGSGRHSIYAGSLGYKVTSVDINKDKLYKLNKYNFIEAVQLDIECNDFWPFKEKTFDVIIVSNYLYRPILQNIVKSIKKEGKLLYETFTSENSTLGKPNNKDYLLKSQELLNLAKHNCLDVINYEEIILENPIKKAVQRLYARVK
jgi:SAM-dependent methyltransferase